MTALNKLSLVLSYIRKNKTQIINPQTLLHLDWQPLVRQKDPQASGSFFLPLSQFLQINSFISFTVITAFNPP